VAESEWPALISWSAIPLTAATRSLPMASVSRANSLNLSHSNYFQNKNTFLLK
jgi:hypothetical protein